MSNLTTACLLGALAGVTGCHWILPLGGFGPGAEAGAGDQLRLDGPHDPDIARPDALPLDAVVDRPPPPDLGGPDVPRDLTLLPDVGVDVALPDAGPDAPPPQPCFGASPLPMTGWTDMTICETGGGITQDQAAGICGQGWHLCTATDYLNRGGKTKVTTSPALSFWLAACVVPGQPPLDTTCAGWQPGCPSPCPVGWGCSGPPGVTRTGSDRFPLKGPHPYCYRMGQDKAAYGAYWFAFTPTSTAPTGAICCLDP